MKSLNICECIVPDKLNVEYVEFEDGTIKTPHIVSKDGGLIQMNYCPSCGKIVESIKIPKPYVPKFKVTEIEGIRNYYGGINIMEHKGKYYWMMDDWDSDEEDLTQWTEIPKKLYKTLLEFNANKIQK